MKKEKNKVLETIAHAGLSEQKLLLDSQVYDPEKVNELIGSKRSKRKELSKKKLQKLAKLVEKNSKFEDILYAENSKLIRSEIIENIIAEAEAAFETYVASDKSEEDERNLKNDMYNIYRKYGRSADLNKQRAMLEIIKYPGEFNKEISYTFARIASKEAQSVIGFASAMSDRTLKKNAAEYLSNSDLPTRWAIREYFSFRCYSDDDYELYTMSNIQ